MTTSITKPTLKTNPASQIKLLSAVRRFLESHQAAMADAHWRRDDKGPVKECGCGCCREAREAVLHFETFATVE